MRTSLFLLTVFIASTFYSQTTDSTAVLKKNKIGVGGIPTLFHFDQISRNTEQYTVTYTRIGAKFNFRSSINHQSSFYNYGDTSPYYLPLTTAMDTLKSRSTSSGGDKNLLDIRLGIEKNWRKNRTTWLVGVDAVAGRSKNEQYHSEFYKAYAYDSLGNPGEEMQDASLTRTTRDITSYLFTGLSPVLGWEYKVNKTFGVAIQYRPVFYMRHDIESVESIYERKGRELFDGEQTETYTLASSDGIRSDFKSLELFLTVNF